MEISLARCCGARPEHAPRVCRARDLHARHARCRFVALCRQLARCVRAAAEREARAKVCFAAARCTHGSGQGSAACAPCRAAPHRADPRRQPQHGEQPASTESSLEQSHGSIACRKQQQAQVQGSELQLGTRRRMLDRTAGPTEIRAQPLHAAHRTTHAAALRTPPSEPLWTGCSGARSMPARTRSAPCWFRSMQHGSDWQVGSGMDAPACARRRIRWAVQGDGRRAAPERQRAACSRQDAAASGDKANAALRVSAASAQRGSDESSEFTARDASLRQATPRQGAPRRA
jgi:hypothetical protein